MNTHPLKVLKYCPKCGSAELHKSGDRSLKCADCGFHFFINSSAAVAALVTDESGKLMLVTRGVEPNYGKLDLPGGFIDPLESAEDAVRRELKEELGLKVKNLKYLESAPNEYVFSAFTVFTLDMAFQVIAESVEDLKPMDDILAYKFYAEEELDYDDIPAPSIRKFVKDYFQSTKHKQ
ncbi:NUDIX domain-containing protein [Draconibacterium orientale]|uniref:NUDIX domain-containing protein n=1 Tax=Draconibacterium orientale TaxID=1168034 RepID=A0A1H9YCP2_9BACT|nr:NUDIX domain-containing protein [Draconibacterium orientale]SES66770.1 NUDIX domain-containing protein [Draconibacterium orientale]